MLYRKNTSFPFWSQLLCYPPCWHFMELKDIEHNHIQNFSDFSKEHSCVSFTKASSAAIDNIVCLTGTGRISYGIQPVLELVPFIYLLEDKHEFPYCCFILRWIEGYNSQCNILNCCYLSKIFPFVRQSSIRYIFKVFIGLCLIQPKKAYVQFFYELQVHKNTFKVSGLLLSCQNSAKVALWPHYTPD